MDNMDNMDLIAWIVMYLNGLCEAWLLPIPVLPDACALETYMPHNKNLRAIEPARCAVCTVGFRLSAGIVETVAHAGMIQAGLDAREGAGPSGRADVNCKMQIRPGAGGLEKRRNKLAPHRRPSA
jgi:hypothetical protein